MSGELKLVAVADLGGLGAEEGPGTLYTATRPNVLPPLLPWLMVLLLFLLKANRRAQAWWVLLPLGLVAGGCGLVETLTECSASSECAQFLEVVTVLALGLAMTWLLAPYLRRSHRLLTFLLMLLTLAGASLLSFVLRQGADLGWESGGPLALAVLVCTLALSLALGLTGRMCRRRFSGLRCFFWLLGWVTAFWLLLALTVSVIALVTHSDGLELWQFGLVVLLPTGLSFGTLLPFLVLSLSNGFYRERLKGFLQVEPAAPPVMAAPPTTGATA